MLSLLSRQGTYMTMLTNWDHRLVQDVAALEDLWATVKDHQPEIVTERVSTDLATQLGLPVAMLVPEQSACFKHHYRSNWHNQGVMVREIDVIRRLERW